LWPLIPQTQCGHTGPAALKREASLAHRLRYAAFKREASLSTMSACQNIQLVGRVSPSLSIQRKTIQTSGPTSPLERAENKDKRRSSLSAENTLSTARLQMPRMGIEKPMPAWRRSISHSEEKRRELQIYAFRNSREKVTRAAAASTSGSSVVVASSSSSSSSAAVGAGVTAAAAGVGEGVAAAPHASMPA